MGVMHAGDATRSRRLQSTLDALRRAGERGLTTLELEKCTDSRAVHSDVSALRLGKPGYLIDCRFDHCSEGGIKIYRYRLVEPATPRKGELF